MNNTLSKANESINDVISELVTACVTNAVTKFAKTIEKAIESGVSTALDEIDRRKIEKKELEKFLTSLTMADYDDNGNYLGSSGLIPLGKEGNILKDRITTALLSRYFLIDKNPTIPKE